MISENKHFSNLIIAGAPKAGTTSLFEYLALHPEICASTKKETRFFLPLKFHEPLPPMSEYEKFFSNYKNEKYKLDATPNYLFSDELLPKTILEKTSNPKIIILIREPVSRIFSLYRYYKSTLLSIPSQMTFEEYIEKSFEQINLMETHNQENWYSRGVKSGMYLSFLKIWFDVFKDHDNIRIFFFDDLMKSPHNILNEICTWLEIDPTLIDENKLKVSNKTVAYRSNLIMKGLKNINKLISPLIPGSHRAKKNFNQKLKAIFQTEKKEFKNPETKKMLQDFYKQHNIELAKFLREKKYHILPSWLNEN